MTIGLGPDADFRPHDDMKVCLGCLGRAALGPLPALAYLARDVELDLGVPFERLPEGTRWNPRKEER